MKSWIIGLVGVLLGSAATYGYLSHRYQAELVLAGQQNEAQKAAAAQTESELAASRKRLEAIEEVNRQLTAKNQSAAPAEAETEISPVEAAPEPQRRDRTAEMKAFSDRIIKREVDRWKNSLKLTPDQLALLSQTLQNKFQNGQPGNWANPAGMQAELLQILTPQQKDEYTRIQARESQARLELRVQTQLSQVQVMFDLTEAQKDQIFQKFAALEQNPSPTPAPAPGASTNRNQARQAQAQRRIQALQGILSPEQLRQYQQSMENNNGGGFQGR